MLLFDDLFRVGESLPSLSFTEKKGSALFRIHITQAGEFVSAGACARSERELVPYLPSPGTQITPRHIHTGGYALGIPQVEDDGTVEASAIERAAACHRAYVELLESMHAEITGGSGECDASRALSAVLAYIRSGHATADGTSVCPDGSLTVLFDVDGIDRWWLLPEVRRIHERRALPPSDQVVLGTCFRCGGRDLPMNRVGKQQGIPAIYSFNASSWTGYGHDQNRCASICEACAENVEKGLVKVLNESGRMFGDNVLLWWAEDFVPWDEFDAAFGSDQERAAVAIERLNRPSVVLSVWPNKKRLAVRRYGRTSGVGDRLKVWIDRFVTQPPLCWWLKTLDPVESSNDDLHHDAKPKAKGKGTAKGTKKPRAKKQKTAEEACRDRANTTLRVVATALTPRGVQYGKDMSSEQLRMLEQLYYQILLDEPPTLGLVQRTQRLIWRYEHSEQSNSKVGKDNVRPWHINSIRHAWLDHVGHAPLEERTEMEMTPTQQWLYWAGHAVREAERIWRARTKVDSKIPCPFRNTRPGRVRKVLAERGLDTGSVSEYLGKMSLGISGDSQNFSARELDREVDYYWRGYHQRGAEIRAAWAEEQAQMKSKAENTAEESVLESSSNA